MYNSRAESVTCDLYITWRENVAVFLLLLVGCHGFNAAGIESRQL